MGYEYTPILYIIDPMPYSSLLVGEPLSTSKAFPATNFVTNTCPVLSPVTVRLFTIRMIWCHARAAVNQSAAESVAFLPRFMTDLERILPPMDNGPVLDLPQSPQSLA